MVQNHLKKGLPFVLSFSLSLVSLSISRSISQLNVILVSDTDLHVLSLRSGDQLS